ncbi:MAG: sialate O-acetylesterase [Lentisphaerae bacterium]|nr:sialate O-acetylesterase [Lentisphaerota bacterium]
MKIASGLMPYQVLQRSRRGTASASLRGTCGVTADGEVRATVLKRGRPMRGFSRTPIGRCRGGAWRGTLARLPVGGPYDVVLEAGTERITVRRILVGDVWVMAGQSNMVGDGQIEKALRPHPLVHAFYAWDEWRLAVEPVHVPSASRDPVYCDKPIVKRQEILRAHRTATKGTGPGLAFARAMVRRTGIPQGLIPCAAGGTSMAQWSPGHKHLEGRSLYGAMLRRVRLQGQPVAGVLWYQGEADAAGDTSAYTDGMRKLVQSVRKDFKHPSLPWVVVQLGKTHLFSPEESEQAPYLSIREQQRLLPRRIGNLSVVPPIDLPMEDGIHLAAEGQNVLGERLARAAAHRLKVKGARNAIELKGLRCIPCPDNWGQYPAIEVEFANVAGDLQSDGVATGFRLIKPDGTVLKRIHKVLFKGGGRLVVVPYTYPDISMKGYRLSYGYDLDAYCNIHDGEGMSLPAFAPQPIEGVKPE